MRYAELKGIKLTAYLYDYKLNLYKIYNSESDYELESFVDYYFSNKSTITELESNIIPLFWIPDIERTDSVLIQVVEEFNSDLKLKIVEIPNDVDWYIDEDESGPECIREKSRCWS